MTEVIAAGYDRGIGFLVGDGGRGLMVFGTVVYFCGEAASDAGAFSY